MNGKVISIREARRQRYENRPDLMVDMCLNSPARLARIEARRAEDLRRVQEQERRIAQAAQDRETAQRMSVWAGMAALLSCVMVVAAAVIILF